MLIPYDDMTNDARRVLDRAQHQAARRNAEQAGPEHLLLAILDEAGSLVYKVLTALGTAPDQIVGLLAGQLPPAAEAGTPRPLAHESELVVHFATKEAYQLGHRQIDALHLLLGIFYLGRGLAFEALQGAGVRLVALRQYVLERPALAQGFRVSREDQLRHVLRPSPIFYGLLVLVVASGGALFFGASARYAGALTLLFVVSGWIVSLCVHEFCHALAAFVGGDRSVRDKGYLTLDPRKYTHPFLSIVLPIVFLLLGGLGLPGGAVYVDRGKLRSARWDSFVSAAGPLGTLACTLLTVAPFLLPWHNWINSQNVDFWAALAFLAFVQVTAIVFNLLPIPGLDGFGIIAPGLPLSLQQNALRLGSIPLILLYMILWQDSPISDGFWRAIFNAADFFRIPIDLVFMAMDRFPF